MELFDSEEWRPVVGYEGLYEVSNLGRVRSNDRSCKCIRNGEPYSFKIKGQILKCGYDEEGYVRINLQDIDHRGKRFGVHRLVALAFIPNPNNLPVVNHLDGVKYHNSVDNLEWTSLSGNMQHAIRIGLITKETFANKEGVKKALSMKVRCIETGDVYDSMIEAERQLGLWWGSVSESCSKGKCVHGLHFERI